MGMDGVREQSPPTRRAYVFRWIMKKGAMLRILILCSIGSG